MNRKENEVLQKLPPEFPGVLLPSIREEFLQSNKTIVVLDDDPTGTQTCSDVVVLISWTVNEIADELIKKPSILFILTNSRSLTPQHAIQLTEEISKNLRMAIEKTGREIILISRSDSTLRGHFPVEVDALVKTMAIPEVILVLIPAFIEGKRYTIDDIHYIVEDQELVPVSETPFARDVVFGYKNSNLKKWIEEKTNGNINRNEVVSLTLEDIRNGGPQRIKDILISCSSKNVIIVNATGYRDLEVVALGLIMAEKEGKRFLYRSSATFVPILAGMISGQTYIPVHKNLLSNHGALILVGSYVPKTTAQLNWLLSTKQYDAIEISVGDILNEDHVESLKAGIILQIDAWLAAGKNVILYTSRKQEIGSDINSSLNINARVSEVLVQIVKSITIRPRYILAKGGITSSDIASKALQTKKAKVLGAIIPGVPVWQLDKESKFPDLVYLVFPGNVGGEKALEEVVDRLKG